MNPLALREPEEEELRDLARRLGAAKKELMVMGKVVVGQPGDTATEAHELVSEVGEAIKASRELIKAALRGMGAASDISEVSGLARLPQPPPVRPSLGDLAPPAGPPRNYPANPVWLPQSTPAASIWPPPYPALQGNPHRRRERAGKSHAGSDGGPGE